MPRCADATSRVPRRATGPGESIARLLMRDGGGPATGVVDRRIQDGGGAERRLAARVGGGELTRNCAPDPAGPKTAPTVGVTLRGDHRSGGQLREIRRPVVEERIARRRQQPPHVAHLESSFVPAVHGSGTLTVRHRWRRREPVHEVANCGRAGATLKVRHSLWTVRRGSRTPSWRQRPRRRHERLRPCHPLVCKALDWSPQPRVRGAVVG